MLKLHQEHFQADLPPDVAEQLFKESVNSIEMAISSYCNRRCRYCPNHLVDRHSADHVMTDGLFNNIIRQLCRIDYSADISIHRYNEPLANKSNALLRIKQIHSSLPNAKINVFTNGDYLNSSLLRLLADIGVSSIIATLHVDDSYRTFPELETLLRDRVAPLNLPFEFACNEKTRSHHALTTCGNLKLDYQVVDFWALKENGALRAYDRGGIIPSTGFERTQPCLMPFMQMQIEYDGTLLPCCNIHSELESHQPYLLGKLDDSKNLFVEWTNQNYVNWRKNLITFSSKAPPCNNCDMNT